MDHLACPLLRGTVGGQDQGRVAQVTQLASSKKESAMVA